MLTFRLFYQSSVLLIALFHALCAFDTPFNACQMLWLMLFVETMVPFCTISG
jgi:hypothetical protein